MKKKILLFMLSGMMMLSPVTTIYATESVTVSDNTTKADTTTTKPETTKVKTTSTKTKETPVNITRYTNKKVSTYSKAGSGKKVKTLAKGTKIKLVAKATVKGKTYYKLSKSSGTQWVIGSALSKSKPTTKTVYKKVDDSNNSASNQNNNNSNSSTSKNNTSKNKSNYKEDSRYKKLPAALKKRADKVMNKYPNIKYQEFLDVTDMIGIDTLEEWMNDGFSWNEIVETAEKVTGDYILE